jgi:hypothetical protein
MISYNFFAVEILSPCNLSKKLAIPSFTRKPIVQHPQPHPLPPRGKISLSHTKLVTQTTTWIPYPTT